MARPAAALKKTRRRWHRTVWRADFDLLLSHHTWEWLSKESVAVHMRKPHPTFQIVVSCQHRQSGAKTVEDLAPVPDTPLSPDNKKSAAMTENVILEATLALFVVLVGYLLIGRRPRSY